MPSTDFARLRDERMFERASRSSSSPPASNTKHKARTKRDLRVVDDTGWPVQAVSADDHGYKTRKRVEVRTTKNTEKSVRRRLFLEDGRVLDTGEPDFVVVDTVEDRHSHDEEEDADERVRRQWRGRELTIPVKQKRSEVSKAGDVVDDSFERTVNTLDVKENVVMTSVSRDLGRVPRRAIDKAIRDKRPLSEVLEQHYVRRKRDDREQQEVGAKQRRHRSEHKAYRYYEDEAAGRFYEEQGRQHQRQREPEVHYHSHKERSHREHRQREPEVHHYVHKERTQKDLRHREPEVHHYIHKERSQKDLLRQREPEVHYHSYNDLPKREPEVHQYLHKDSIKHGHHQRRGQGRHHNEHEHEQQNGVRPQATSSGRPKSRHYDYHKTEKDCYGEPVDLWQDSKPVVVYQSKKHKKIIDTEDVHNISRRTDDGRIVTETFRTHQHEVIKDRESPDDGSEKDEKSVKRDKEHFSHLKQDEFVDYFSVDPKTQAARLVSHGPRHTLDKREATKGRHDWADVDEQIRQNRETMRRRMEKTEQLREELFGETLASRKDALTKKPLNFVQEERTRIKETDKWLEMHFGSDWSLTSPSVSSSFGGTRFWRHQFDHGNLHGAAVGKKNDDGAANVRRSLSFSSIPIKYVNPGERIVRTKTTTIKPGFEKTVQSTVTRSGHHINTNQRSSEHQYANSSTAVPIVHSGSNNRHYHSMQSLSKSVGRSPVQQDKKPGQLKSGLGDSTLTLSRRSYYFGDWNGANRGEDDRVREVRVEHNAAEKRSASAHSELIRPHTSAGHDEPDVNVAPVTVSEVRERRLYPTLERKDSKRSRVVYRSESKRSANSRLREQSQPTFVSQITREKLYPALSENNILQLLASKSKSSRSSRSDSSQSVCMADRLAKEERSRSYLGFRSLERSDAASRDELHYAREYGNEIEENEKSKSKKNKKVSLSSALFSRRLGFGSPSRASSSKAGSQTGSKKDSKSEMKRSQSFLLVNGHARSQSAQGLSQFHSLAPTSYPGAGEAHFVYDRHERKFLPSTGLRHGHSDLRLDRGFKETPAWHKEPVKRTYSRELVHQHEQLEPQRFKTIIFLS